MIIYLETLGCSRNQVDSQIMLGKLEQKGHQITDDPFLAQVIVVNTCGFISAASDEAVDVILQMAKLKQDGNCERLIATGCLQVYQRLVINAGSEIPEFLSWLGTGRTLGMPNGLFLFSHVDHAATPFADPFQQLIVTDR